MFWHCWNGFSKNVTMPPEEFVIAALEGRDLILSKCLSSAMCHLLGLSSLVSAVFPAKFFPWFALQKDSFGSVAVPVLLGLPKGQKKCRWNEDETLWPAAVLQEGLSYSRPCAQLSVPRACLAALTSFEWRDGCRRSACFGTRTRWWLASDIYEVQK